MMSVNISFSLLPARILVSADSTDLWLLALLEESLLTLLLGGLVLGEITVGGNLLDDGAVDAAEVDLLACGNNVAGVDAAEGDTVGLEGPGDKEHTLVECLEEDHALAAETTGQENEDGAGLEGLAELSWAGGLAGLTGNCMLVFVGCEDIMYVVMRCVFSWFLSNALNPILSFRPGISSSFYFSNTTTN